MRIREFANFSDNRRTKTDNILMKEIIIRKFANICGNRKTKSLILFRKHKDPEKIFMSILVLKRSFSFKCLAENT